MALTAEQILAADDMGLKKVAVPEWGGDVFIRLITAGERERFERLFIGYKDRGIPDNYRCKYLLAALCDEKGNQLFTAENLDALAAKSGATIGRIYDAAMAHNKMTEEAVQELGKS